MTPAMITACLLLLLAANLVRGDDDDIHTLSAATTVFSQKLYHRIAPPNPNIIISGYSVHSALTMTSLGALGDTATELSTVLGLNTLPGYFAHQAYHDTIIQLNSVTEVKVNTANALFINPDIPIEPQFIADARDYYLAKVSNFNLSAPGGPEKEINAYVEENTDGMIKDLLPSGSVTAATVTVLIDTIAFNGTWQQQFSVNNTQKQDFHRLDGTTSQVDMMNDVRDVNIKRGVFEADVVDLPFSNNRFSLYVVVPNKVDGITDLENAVAQPGNVNQLFEGLTPRQVNLSLPKLKIESTFELSKTLRQLGLDRSFTPSLANFQGISTGFKAIGEVLHKAVIEITETGTVAAAVTAVIIGTSASEPETLVADRPFLFFLKDKGTGQTLFQGKFSN